MARPSEGWKLRAPRCKTWEGAFVAQAGGYGCRARWAERRIETMRKALYRLNTEIWKAEQAIARRGTETP